MSARRRGSIRLWQTELFVAVIVVAILILSGSLSAGLKTTLTRMAETNELRNASALARRLEPELPLALNGMSQVREVVTEYRDIYGGGIWVYDGEGVLLESAYDSSPVDAVLESALLAGLNENPSYAASDLKANGWVVAAKSLHSTNGELQGVVITASAVDQPVAILTALRDRLWVTFWISLVIAGLLGLGFSEIIARRIRAMSDAAAAMAGGDFRQQLPTGLVPNEIQDLAESYNTMATTLGKAFGEIKESRHQIAAVVESMAEGVLAFDAAGIVTVTNPESARLLGVPGHELADSPVEEISDEPGVLEIVRAGLAGESLTETVAVGQFMVLFHCTPLRSTEDTIEGAVLVLADVTEQHRIEDAQRRFIADASHEMRTPIAALKGMLELLVDGAAFIPEVRDDFLHTMQIETDRLGRLVADLLTLAQLEGGSLQLKLAPESVADLLGDVANVMQTLAEQAHVDLVVEAPSGVRVVVDRDKMVQVLLGFTDNALKHSKPGTAVHLRAVATAGSVRLEVADQGLGIEPDELSRVFERFYRADTARAGGRGTGLGLAIAKEIVEAHGSKIDVASLAGVGTTFGFELPSE